MRTLSSVRSILRTRREACLARATLAREIADYNTPAQRLDLDAMLERCSPEETRVIDEIRRRQSLQVG